MQEPIKTKEQQEVWDRMLEHAKPLTDEEKKLMNEVAERVPWVAKMLRTEFPIPLGEKPKSNEEIVKERARRHEESKRNGAYERMIEAAKPLTDEEKQLVKEMRELIPWISKSLNTIHPEPLSD